MQHLINATTATDDPDQGLRGQPLLIESKANRLDRIRKIDRKMSLFVGFDQGREDIEKVSVGCAHFRTP